MRRVGEPLKSDNESRAFYWAACFSISAISADWGGVTAAPLELISRATAGAVARGHIGAVIERQADHLGDPSSTP
jgi:hypothetical protein